MASRTRCSICGHISEKHTASRNTTCPANRTALPLRELTHFCNFDEDFSLQFLDWKRLRRQPNLQFWCGIRSGQCLPPCHAADAALGALRPSRVTLEEGAVHDAERAEEAGIRLPCALYIMVFI